MVMRPSEPRPIMSARRPLGSGTSQSANTSWLKNKRVTPRATSCAAGGASSKHRRAAGLGERAIRPDLEWIRNDEKRSHPRRWKSAIEDVVADRRDAGDAA